MRYIARKDMHDLVKGVEDLAGTLKSASDSHGIHVVTETQKEVDERRDQMFEELASRQRATGSNEPPLPDAE